MVKYGMLKKIIIPSSPTRITFPDSKHQREKWLMRRKIKGKKNGGKYEAEIRCKGVRHVIERRGMEKSYGGWRKTHTRSQRESSVKEADGARRIVPSSRLATKNNTNFTLVHSPAHRPRATPH